MSKKDNSIIFTGATTPFTCCLECSKRFRGCHDSCEDYIKVKQQRAIERYNYLKQHKSDIYQFDYRAKLKKNQRR